MRRTPRLLIALAIVAFVIFGTIFAIKLAKGYRPSLKQRSLQGTGLLSADSTPEGASVFINDKLTTATDDTLNLPPGEYKIKIAKDGYIPWEKTLILEKELVTQTNARLFPAVPDLKPLTFSGALNPTPSPNGQKIVFAVENATTETKNGLYVLDLDRPFSLNPDPRQITRTSQNYDFTQAQLTWSPDSSQVLATLNAGQTNELNVLLNASSFNDLADLKDVTATLPVILKDWHELLDKKDHEGLIELPDFMQQVATQSASAFYFSPEDDRLLYLATEALTIPDDLVPPLPASSTQPQTRNIEPNRVYVYDPEEDKNYLLDLAQPIQSQTKLTDLDLFRNRYSSLQTLNTQWYPDSRHLITIQNDDTNKKITISEYDNTNQQVVYAGPFSGQYAFPWSNGSKLTILASLNGGSNLPPNLYSINLK